MVSISQYIEKHSKITIVELVTRNPKTAEKLRELLKGEEKVWYDEQEERCVRYRFRIPKKRKEEFKFLKNL